MSSSTYEIIRSGDVDGLRAELEGGLSADSYSLDSSSVSERSTPLLFVACNFMNRDMVELLLQSGANPNRKAESRDFGGSESEPCLMAAIASKDIEIVRMMLEKGADPNIQTRWTEETRNYVHALTLANSVGAPKIHALLVQYGAEVPMVYNPSD